MTEVTPDEIPIPPDDIMEAPVVRVPPPPYVSPFQTIRHTWYGTDGSVWDLSNPENGIFMVQEGIEGLHMPPTEFVDRESPSMYGSSYHGYQISSRPVAWVVYIYSDEGSDHWFDLDSRFWNSMQFGETGTWRVTRPNGDFRELHIQPRPQPVPIDRDPGRFGWMRWPIEFKAVENPFWTVPYEVPGSQVSFVDKEGKDFFGDGQGGPPLHISPRDVHTAREIKNPGDEPVYPKYEIRGPMDYVDFEVDGRQFRANCNLLAGETFTITTDPRYFGVVDNSGANRLEDVTTWVFSPIPARKTVPVKITAHGTGGGAVMIYAPPLFHRAW